MSNHLSLKRYTVFKHQLTADFEFSGYSFRTTYWYNSVDFFQLEEKYGNKYLKKIIFHIIAFEINKFGSLAPKTIDFGPLSEYVTQDFTRLWKLIFKNVWAQWRYENNLPNYEGPAISQNHEHIDVSAVSVIPGSVAHLSFCGGGKDSLVSAKLLERSDLPFATLGYSSSIYGNASAQHQLIDDLLDQTTSVKRHKLWVFDDFLDSPILYLHPDMGIKTFCAAETPSSIFGCLPIILMEGYTRVILGHERSADDGNMTWDKTGEIINHQWGKSFEAEVAIQEYVASQLICNLVVGSILKPIYDVMIFSLLQQDSEYIKYTHSCNIQKPWCMKCPKCAYVWLNYMAYLPIEQVNDLFHKNLFDIEENQIWFSQLLGLESHTPFECVGQPEEARIAFELCRRKGLKGKAMDMYIQAFPAPDFTAYLENLLAIDEKHTALPDDLMAGPLQQMRACRSRALVNLKALLSPIGF